MDVEQVGDRQGQSGEQRVDDVQRERHEHEREFEGLGYAGEERGRSGRGQNADGQLPLPLVRDVDHRQGSGGQAEHQDRVEAGREDARGRVACGEPGELTGHDGAVRRLIVAVDEPDIRVQDVVKSDGDQHAVGESVDECAQCSGAADELPEGRQPGVEDRIEVAHPEGDDQGRD